jgi:hypothetical protein
MRDDTYKLGRAATLLAGLLVVTGCVSTSGGSGATNTGPAPAAASSESTRPRLPEKEVRKAIAAALVGDIRIGSPLIVGRRRLVNARIGGPTPGQDWLTRSEYDGYCVTLTAQKFYYGAIDRDFTIAVRMRQHGSRLVASTYIEPVGCRDAAPFPEVEELSARLAPTS